MFQRVTILLLIISFVTPTFAEVNTQENHGHEKTSYGKNHHKSDHHLNAVLKETSEEKNDSTHKPILTAELIDFNFLSTVLTQHHSRADWNINNPFAHQPLFKLNCIFLI